MDKKDFATRISQLAGKYFPHIKNKEYQVSELTEEKITTVRNWIFNGKKPPSKKRLSLSDKAGVSESYLFDEGEKSYPIAKYNEETDSYSIPLIKENDIEKTLNRENLIPIHKRIETNIEENIINHIKEIERTFFFEIEGIEFNPFIVKGDLLLINDTAEIKEGIFSILIRDSKIEITTIRFIDNDIFFGSGNGEIKRPRDNDTIIPILITINNRYR